MSKVDQLLKRAEFYEKVASQVPEANSLLNKATVFERLALYSDRKSFLQALGQQSPEDQENIQVARRALSLLQQLGIGQDKTTSLGNAAVFGKVDVPAMRREIEHARLAGGISPLGHQNELNQLKQLSDSFKVPGSSSGPVTIPEVTIEGGMPSVNTEQQNALGKFVTVNGITFVDPKKMNDGKLGPETRKALEAFKRWYNEKATGKKITSDSEALQLVKFIVDNDPQKYG